MRFAQFHLFAVVIIHDLQNLQMNLRDKYFPYIFFDLSTGCLAQGFFLFPASFGQ